jgi:bacterioferritin-associated ferredoxin
MSSYHDKISRWIPHRISAAEPSADGEGRGVDNKPFVIFDTILTTDSLIFSAAAAIGKWKSGMTTAGGKSSASLAAKALRAGQFGLGRSFRLHRRRSPFCHRGWCQQCKVRLSDGTNVLACQSFDTAVAQVKQPRPFLRGIAFFSERLSPWFHESRFLRPRFLRNSYLHILRRLSAALPLSKGHAYAAPQWERRECDTLVVGGGLAGMKAAAVYAEAGRRVIVVEAERASLVDVEEPELVGMIGDTRSKISAFGGELIEGATCVGLYETSTAALCSTPTGAMTVSFRELIVATGAYDRQIAVEGNDLPGSIGLRAFERLLSSGSIPENARLGFYGNFSEAARADRAAAASGKNLDWLAGPGLLPKVVSPAYEGCEVTRITGRGRIRKVVLSTGQKLKCDLLILGFSQPTYELQMQAGCGIQLDEVSGAMTAVGEANIPMLVVGEAAGAWDTKSAYDHADAAAKARLAGKPNVQPPTVASYFPKSQTSDAAFICFCEDVRFRDVRKAVEDGFDNVELVKRRTGAGTGPCQGKLCHPELLRCVAELGCAAELPTIRPLVRPVSLAAFAGYHDE